MPIHVAITRRIKPGCEAEFQQALREFFQASFAHGGVLGATMIVPPLGSDSREFGILRTFANEKERDDFYAFRPVLHRSPDFGRGEVLLGHEDGVRHFQQPIGHVAGRNGCDFALGADCT